MNAKIKWILKKCCASIQHRFNYYCLSLTNMADYLSSVFFPSSVQFEFEQRKKKELNNDSYAMISLHDVEHMKRQFLNSECKFVELMSFVRFLRVKLFYLSDVTSTIISFFFFIVVRFFFSSYTNFVEKRGIWCL